MRHALEQAEFSLVLFTLFTQASVGAFWVLLVSDFLKRRAPDAVLDAFTRIGTGILIPLTALGLFFSATHLGRPQFAFRALANVGSSWLSREVWAFGLFFALAAVYTYLWRSRSRDAELRRLVGLFTGLVGVLGVWSQAMVYRIPGRPMWDHPSTTLLFAATALTLGPLAVAVIYSFAWGRTIDLRLGGETVRRSHRRLGMTLAIGAAVYALALFWRISYLTAGGAETEIAVAGKAAMGANTMRSALLLGSEITRQHGWMLQVQVALGIGAPVALAILLWYLHRRGAGLKLCNLLTAAGLGLTLAGELAGRALFYLTGRPWF